MKIKNVNFIEKHLEKVLLGVGLACALGVLYVFAINDPYYVLAANGDKLYPADVEVKLLDTAKKLEKDLASPNSGLPTIVIPEYTKTFEYLANQTPPSPRPGLTYWWASPGLDPMVFRPAYDGDITRPNYIVPEVPLPTDITARADFAKIGRLNDPAQREQLIALTHATGPGDFFYVTVSGVFDMNKWRDAILASTPEKQRIKDEWYRNSYMITVVKLERNDWDEEKQDWTPQPPAILPIPALPGNPDFSNPPSTFSEADGQTILREIRLNRRLITEPPFLPVDPKRPWSLTSNIDYAARLRQLNVELVDLIKRRDALVKDPATGKDREITRLPVRTQSEVASLTGKISSTNEEIAKAQTSLHSASGQIKSDDTGAFSMVQKVYAHDVDVLPGKRYRYRLVVGIQNPLFQRGQQLQPQQKILMNNKVTLYSNYKDNEGWVEVTIPKNNHFFVVGAKKEDNTVEAEVWKVFNAGWMRQTFSVQPGDAIGQNIEATVDEKPYQVDFKTGRTLVDLYFTGQVASGQQVGQAIMVDAKDQLQQVLTDAQAQDPERLLLMQELGAPPAPAVQANPAANAPPPAGGQPPIQAPAPRAANPQPGNPNQGGNRPPTPPVGGGAPGPNKPGGPGGPAMPPGAPGY
jgi:hypothetical protein